MNAANAAIHPTAIVEPGARLGSGVAIGAYSIIGEHVEIGDGCRIGPHVVIQGHTQLGRDNQVFQFCSIGAAPQDKKYAGEATRLEIGDRNTIREFCTFNCGTVQDAGLTRMGSDNWIMAYVHVAHDCVIGNHTIFANNAQLAGHVSVGDWAILGGFPGRTSSFASAPTALPASTASCCRICRLTSRFRAIRHNRMGSTAKA